jgi:hypothetical protein
MAGLQRDHRYPDLRGPPKPLNWVTGEDAFTLLRTASKHLHRKLREVAADVVDTGILPDLRPPPRNPPAE